MNFDFARKNDVASTKAQLRPVAEEVDFAWLKPVVDMTLAEFVCSSLINSPPKESQYSVFSLQENVSVANDIINRCLSRRTQIYDMEAIALKTAITYQQELQLASSEADLARLQAEANLALASQPMTTAIENGLSKQASVRAGMLQARIALHNMTGSSLNYGEQVSFMRSVYADNIRNLIERASAISRGLMICYGIAPDVLPEMPLARDQTDDLERMVWWLRGVVSALERMEKNETISIAYIPIFRGKYLPFSDFIKISSDWLSFMETGVVEFELTEDVVLRFFPKLVDKDAPMRIVGVGVSPVLGRWFNKSYNSDGSDKEEIKKIDAANKFIDNMTVAGRSLDFPCTVVGPKQKDRLEQASLSLGLVHLIINDSVSMQLQPSNPDRMRNHSPHGVWRIQIGPETVQGFWAPSQASYRMKGIYDSLGFGYTDVVLCLALAHNERESA